MMTWGKQKAEVHYTVSLPLPVYREMSPCVDMTV